MSTNAENYGSTLPPESVVPTFDPEQFWHSERLKGIGGSEVHNLFPCLNLEDKSDTGSRYGCARKLSYQKLGVDPDYAFTPETLRLFERGHLLEDAAAQRYMQKTGERVFRSNMPHVSSVWPWMRCNIDRRIKIADGKRRILECKSANEHVFVKMANEGLPIGYSLQLQHSMAATESDGGAFAVIESPDYVDAVIEQIEDAKLRQRVLDSLWPKFDFVHFEMQRDDQLIRIIAEKEETFWNLVEQKKLAVQLPNISDDRCKTCEYRRTCRGKQFADLNDKIPVRDKKTGVQYVQIEDTRFVEMVADRLTVMKDIDEKSEILKGIDNELQQNWPPDTSAVAIPGTGIKIRWGWQRGASRWDSDALKADAKTIGRKVAFADWVADRSAELVAAFTTEVKETPSIEDLYKKQGAPGRPFVFAVKGSE